MEAPAKSGGTRKMRSRRDLIGRLGMLPPIEFLKKHNPLRRRPPGPELGFDQPPYEIKQFALPLRPAPLPLSMRLYIRLRSLGGWITRLMTAAGRQGRRLMLSLANRFRSSTDRLRIRLQPFRSASANAARALLVRISRLRHAGAVVWCERRVRTATGRLAVLLAALRPDEWRASQTTRLMVRANRVRRALIGLVVCEWATLIAFQPVVLLTAGSAADPTVVNAAGLFLVMLSLAALLLQAWHHRLIDAWRTMELFICGGCGSLRNFSPSLPCPKCDTREAPVFPGQVPSGWSGQAYLTGPLAAAAPALLSCGVLLSTRLI